MSHTEGMESDPRYAAWKVEEAAKEKAAVARRRSAKPVKKPGMVKRTINRLLPHGTKRRKVAATAAVTTAAAVPTAAVIDAGLDKQAKVDAAKAKEYEPIQKSVEQQTNQNEVAQAAADGTIEDPTAQSGELPVSDGETTGYVDLNSDTPTDTSTVTEQPSGGVSPESSNEDTSDSSSGGTSTPSN